MNLNQHTISEKSPYPMKVKVILGETEETKELLSPNELKELLEEVKLFNSENREIQKRIISI